jgi:hypothetical protein
MGAIGYGGYRLSAISYRLGAIGFDIGYPPAMLEWVFR